MLSFDGKGAAVQSVSRAGRTVGGESRLRQPQHVSKLVSCSRYARSDETGCMQGESVILEGTPR
jgi:hypothetical protein